VTSARDSEGERVVNVVPLLENRRAKNGEPNNEPTNPDEPEDGLGDIRRAAMVRRLATLTRDHQAPPEVVKAAKATFNLRSIDDELATLVYDSVVDPGLLSGVRSKGESTRQLTFEGESLAIEVEIASSPRSLTCQLVPAQPAELEIRHQLGTIPLGSDAYGTFHVRHLPEGPVSLRCVPLAMAPGGVSTSWVSF
jgi:hypothetical protein